MARKVGDIRKPSVVRSNRTGSSVEVYYLVGAGLAKPFYYSGQGTNTSMVLVRPQAGFLGQMSLSAIRLNLFGRQSVADFCKMRRQR